MLRQYLVGAAASVCNIAIHALSDGGGHKGDTHRGWTGDVASDTSIDRGRSATVTVLMIAHLAEVLVCGR